MADETTQQPQDMPTEPINVYDFLTVIVDQMAAIAWSKLGLQPDPICGKVAKDIDQAKVAIDVTTHLSTFILPRLEDENDKRRLHNLIRDLRLNYVEKAAETE